MVHYSFINKGIVEHQPTIVTECIPVLIVKTCHTLNRLAKHELIKKNTTNKIQILHKTW